MKNAETIEDLLEILAHLHNREADMTIEKSDATIMFSIARQTFKGTALTDRQFSLMQQKLEFYKPQFVQQGIDYDSCIDNLRQPLREIDRSQYIKVVNDTAHLKHFGENIKWIVVRFPFKKSLIIDIQEIVNFTTYYHSKGSHEHYFMFNEQNIKNICSRFKDKNFVIDKEVLDFYDQIINIEKNIESHISCLTKEKVNILNPLAKQLAETEIGEYNQENYFKYLDRKKRYGIDNTPVTNTSNKIRNDILNRKTSYVFLSSVEHNFENVMNELYYLDRFPLLVVLSKDSCTDELHNVYQATKGYINPNEQVCLFRKEGTHEFNDLVKQYNLNNWLDKNTKVVYINNDKIPKLLLKEKFSPVATLQFSEHRQKQILTYSQFYCDLIVMYAEQVGMLRRYSKFYDGYM